MSEKPTLTPEQLVENGWNPEDAEYAETLLEGLSETESQIRVLKEEKETYKAALGGLIGDRQIRIAHPEFGSCAYRVSVSNRLDRDKLVDALLEKGLSTKDIESVLEDSTVRKSSTSVEYRRPS